MFVPEVPLWLDMGCGRRPRCRCGIDVGDRIAAPAAFGRYDRREIEVEGIADARLDAAIGRVAADDVRVATRPRRGTKEATISFTAPAYQKFESVFRYFLDPRKSAAFAASFRP